MTPRRTLRSAASRALLGALLLFALAVPSSAAPAAGWVREDLTDLGTYLVRYVPQSLDRTKAPPLVVFLHGSGGTPEYYEPFLREAAESTGAVLVLPKSSSSLGWGIGDDEQIVARSRDQVAAELAVDPLRIGIAGHSAGGAYAYLLAYGEATRYSAVFTLSAPFYGVTAVADPGYKAPIRMYYGTDDPNYSTGPEATLKAQWTRLGVPFDEDIVSGYGHNVWPPNSMIQGIRFLVGKSYFVAPPPPPPPSCVADATHLCLQGGRFRVEVTWQDFSQQTGVGTVASATCADSATPTDSGLFWFFTPQNWEMLVKVLDGCALNDHFWVFAAATTNVQYTLTVTDTKTGAVVQYSNPLGTSAPATTDTSAFATCQ